jgi:hypothetical protein
LFQRNAAAPERNSGSIAGVGLANINHEGCIMQNPAKFREYAEECRRLAEQTSGENKATLLVIADAWTNCAVEAERNQKLRAKAAGLSSTRDSGAEGVSDAD